MTTALICRRKSPSPSTHGKNKMSPLVILCFIILVVYTIDLKRQIRETSEEVTRMHRDFLAEASLRYGDELDGEK